MKVRLFLCCAVPALLMLAAPAVAAGGVVIVGTLTHEYVTAPGGTYEGSIVVQNPNDAPQEFRAYQTDYLFNADGTTLYGDPGTAPRTNARWISLTPRQAVLPPKETVTLRYAIQVPDDAGLKGTYWSIIMVEPVDPAAPESSSPAAPDRVTLGIRQVLLYAVQVVTHIQDTGTRQLTFLQVRLAAQDGKRQLLVDAENTGERWLRGALWVELYNRDGTLLGRFDATQQRMYPGTSVRYTVDLAGVQAATYKALIVIDCGGDDVFGASVNLVLGT